MSDQGTVRPLPPSLFARIATAARYAITGVAPETWFGPLQPLQPMAPPEAKGRQFDYPFGANVSYTPRASAAIGFAELRALADALPLLRAVIETRKDQIAALSFTVRPRDPKAAAPDEAARIKATLAFLARPDRRHAFAAWLRMLLEDMLVIDAATIYPRFARDGTLYSLDIVDGATIFPLIGEDGRAPDPPDPAYQQVLHGVPAADFSTAELMYLPRNARAHKLYGMSPVEQIALTVNIALRRDIATLEYYHSGSIPDSFATLPKEWTLDQIKQFQDYFDALMIGNISRRRMLKFMPSGFKLQETRQPPLKDQYDEWLARLVCYAFSVPVSPFVGTVNRATAETLRLQATQEGLAPMRAWVKDALDRIIQVYLSEDDLEFAWAGDDVVDPLQQAQTLQILVGCGVKTVDEARADLGLAPSGKASERPTELGKFNPYHDERGRVTTADGTQQGNPPTKNENARYIQDAAYQGDFHDAVQKQWADYIRSLGYQVTTEAYLSIGGITARLDILYRLPSGALRGIEIKTGEDPTLTTEQTIVYAHAILGAGVTYTGARGAEAGLIPGAPLPAIPIAVVYAAGPGVQYQFRNLNPESLGKTLSSNLLTFATL
jgi:hypothetical protein